VKFLVDEMFSPQVAQRLTDLGHDALHVRDIGLAGATDDEVLRCEPRKPRRRDGQRRRQASAGGMAHALAKRLTRWAEDHPDPYPHVHWLG
jgi:hypothetical protein